MADGRLLTLGAVGALALAASRFGARATMPACELYPLSEDMADVIQDTIGIEYYDFLEMVEDLFSRGSIRTARHEEYHEACITPEGLLLGASSLGLQPGGDVTFSVVVDETARKQDIATRLIESLLPLAFATADMAEVEVRPWVVNPSMARLLEERFGFEPESHRGWSPDAPHMVAPRDWRERLRAYRASRASR